ncbi:MAG: hypothetical protein ABL958_12150 [Bdellovibrionia bacterium]
MKKISIGAIIIVGLIANGCGVGGGGGGSDPDAYKRDLLKADLQELDVSDTTYLTTYDRENGGVISKLFGGTRGADLLNYFRTRVTYTFTKQEIENGSMQLSAAGTFPIDASSTLTVGARNIGTALWYQGLVERKAVTITVAGQTIAVRSTRTGIIEFGDGYRRTNPKTLTDYPSEFRNMIMLHEARHSDCTGGVSDPDIEIIRQAGGELSASGFTRFMCGHLHQNCPTGHQYAGKPVCDLHPWGAYAIGALYVRAALLKYKGQPQEDVLRAAAIDQANRAIPELTKMINGDFGNPDMSSSGYTGSTNGDSGIDDETRRGHGKRK